MSQGMRREEREDNAVVTVSEKYAPNVSEKSLLGYKADVLTDESSVAILSACCHDRSSVCICD